MSLNRIGVRLLTALLAALGSGAATQAAEPAAVISAARTHDTVELTAVAHGLGRAAGGRYELVIVKRGGGGESTIRQGGNLPSEGSKADGPVTLASSKVSLGSGTSIVATLRISLTTGETFTDDYRLAAEN